MRTLEDYLPIVGNEVIANLHRKARPLYGLRVLHINSTFQGGGVAEILACLVPLMNDIGVEADWRILSGPIDFFTLTKRFHNGLQGEPIELTEDMKELYLSQNQQLAEYAKLDADVVIVHDPQPLPLIRMYPKRQPWIWRCHVDLSEPDKGLWEFLTRFVLRYDAMIVSSERYLRPELVTPQVVFTPAIDPLSLKNEPMSEEAIDEHLARLGVPRDKPFILQVSRYDKWKDMDGVVRAFRMIREEVPCRLVLCGSMASDDPEGMGAYKDVMASSTDLVEGGDAFILTDASNAEVNALQRAAAVVTQKSIREGFGLTLTEAMWKGKAVVATRVGGLPLQIDDGVNGLLVPPGQDEQFAAAVLKLLTDSDLCQEYGYRAREKARTDFLVTRLLSAYLDLLTEIMSSSLCLRQR